MHDTNKNTFFQGNTLYLFLRQEEVCSHSTFELSYCLFIIQIFIVIMKICHKLCFYLSILIILFDITKGSRASKKSPPTQACNMLIAIDERLYDVYNRNTKNLTIMVKNMVKGLNQVYQR